MSNDYVKIVNLDKNTIISDNGKIYKLGNKFGDKLLENNNIFINDKQYITRIIYDNFDIINKPILFQDEENIKYENSRVDSYITSIDQYKVLLKDKKYKNTNKVWKIYKLLKFYKKYDCNISHIIKTKCNTSIIPIIIHNNGIWNFFYIKKLSDINIQIITQSQSYKAYMEKHICTLYEDCNIKIKIY